MWSAEDMKHLEGTNLLHQAQRVHEQVHTPPPPPRSLHNGVMLL